MQHAFFLLLSFRDTALFVRAVRDLSLSISAAEHHLTTASQKPLLTSTTSNYTDTNDCFIS